MYVCVCVCVCVCVRVCRCQVFSCIFAVGLGPQKLIHKLFFHVGLSTVLPFDQKSYVDILKKLTNTKKEYDHKNVMFLRTLKYMYRCLCTLFTTAISIYIFLISLKLIVFYYLFVAFFDEFSVHFQYTDYWLYYVTM